MAYKYLKNWKNERALKDCSLPTKISVIDTNSLTKKLCSVNNNNFQVRVISQSISLSNRIVKNMFFKTPAQKGIYRKVILSTRCYPNIEAYTFIPSKYITGRDRFIKILGRRSLGTHILSSTRYRKINTKYNIKGNKIHRVSEYKSRIKSIFVNEVFPISFKLNSLSFLHARGEFAK